MISWASLVPNSVYVCESGYCSIDVVLIGLFYEVIHIYSVCLIWWVWRNRDEK